ncbi:pyridoxal phosphate-dependent transferase [Scleroderma yunnanense]
MTAIDLEKVRARFPSLRAGYIYADNAGGSQVCQEVLDRIFDYLCNTNVQPGAAYSVSEQSSQRILEGINAAALLFNAASTVEVGFGSSTGLIFENISRAMENDITVGDEIIITEEHEAHCGPWKRLADRRGAVVKYWRTMVTSENNPFSLGYNLHDLLLLLSPKTRLVAISACSNVLGSVMPIEDIVSALRKRARELMTPKLEVSVDCVAYAPHRRINVQKWDVDYCVCSLYKVYGAHNAVFYMRSGALQSSLSKIVHHFVAAESSARKIEIGGPGYELVYSAAGVVSYLLALTPYHSLDASFDAIAEYEQHLMKPLLSFLTDQKQYERGVRVVGNGKVDESRVPTISFVVVGQTPIKSQNIVNFFDSKGGIGIRYGHFYAYSLVANMNPRIDPDDGVVRISFVHYNTVKEVERILEVLKEVLA